MELSIEPTDAETVVEELDSVDVNETPPVELIVKVQEWQERLEDGEEG